MFWTSRRKVRNQHKSVRSISAKRFGRRGTFEQLEARAMMAGDGILHWNAIALEAEADDKSGIFGSADAAGPTGASRALAIVHVAMFDAINSVLGQYEPYLIKVVGAGRQYRRCYWPGGPRYVGERISQTIRRV